MASIRSSAYHLSFMVESLDSVVGDLSLARGQFSISFSWRQHASDFLYPSSAEPVG